MRKARRPPLIGSSRVKLPQLPRLQPSELAAPGKVKLENAPDDDALTGVASSMSFDQNVPVAAGMDGSETNSVPLGSHGRRTDGCLVALVPDGRDHALCGEAMTCVALHRSLMPTRA